MKFHQNSPQFFFSLNFNEISVNFSEISLTIFSRVVVEQQTLFGVDLIHISMISDVKVQC